MRRLLQRSCNVFRRGLRLLRWWAKGALGLRRHIHVENRWRLGDEVLAIPFYALLREQYARERLTVAVNHPDLLLGNPCAEVSNDLTEFDCDRYIHARDDVRNVPRVEHLCRRHRVPYRSVRAAVHVRDDESLRRSLPHAGVLVAYSCGAGWACKSWPAEYMRRLCAGWQGGTADVAFVEVGKGCASAGVGTSYIDRLTVGQTAYVISQCKLYLGPDSGLAHVAASVGVSSIVLCGPVDVERAFGVRENVTMVSSPASCRFCWTEGRMLVPGVCPLGTVSDDPVAYRCMRELTPEHVEEAVAAGGFLSRGQS